MFRSGAIKRRSKNRTAPRRLRVEQLERRLALSAAAVLPNLTNERIFNTVPSNGDGNPYGVSMVPADFPRGGLLKPGDALAANFNNSSGQQGTGTTISIIKGSNHSSTATPETFFTSSVGGLSTTPVILKSGFIVEGNIPADSGSPSGVGQGEIQIINRYGKVALTLSNSTYLPDPWYITANDLGPFVQLFVSNVDPATPDTTPNNGGTVTRIDMLILHGTPQVLDMATIGSGYPSGTDPVAFVVGPAGLAFNAASDTLYVTSEISGTGGEIFAIPNAAVAHTASGNGNLIYADSTHLHGPLGLVLAPNGDLITANSDSTNVNTSEPSELVEFTTHGTFVAQLSVDPNPGGAFAIAFGNFGGRFGFAAVDDNTNTLDVWTVPATVRPYTTSDLTTLFTTLAAELESPF
jgi:hypothetical protein